MTQSFIYSDVLADLGWFNPQQEFKKLADVNYVHYINQPWEINAHTVIGYFPGCFAEFHDGHKSVIDEFKKYVHQFTRNYLIVIAPANTDYTVSKYGTDSLHATNKYRFDKIVEVLKDYDGNVAIDLNPMLNNDRDYNFTDLLKDFVERHIGNFKDMQQVPRIICGKDRAYFKNLEKITDKIKIFYASDTTQLSSSGFITKEPKLIKKKDVYLRCNSMDEYDAFRRFFSKHYNSITPVLLQDELCQAENISNHINADVTICKEYASFLPYIPFHRTFIHPLISNNNHTGFDGSLAGKIVLDSDIFTGSTRLAINKLGGTLVAVMDFCNMQDTHEIVDFSDFYNDNYRYPYYDISTRCSMLPFTMNDHKVYNEFVKYAKHINPTRNLSCH